jgi:hypothetical protein
LVGEYGNRFIPNVSPPMTADMMSSTQDLSQQNMTVQLSPDWQQYLNPPSVSF